MANNSAIVRLVASSFSAADYVVFAAFLCLSGAVGIFFSCRGQASMREYFFGSGQMRPIPTGISMGVSFISAIALVGFPAEMYVHGYSYVIAAFSGSLGYFLFCVMVIRCLHPLKMTSINQYFAVRFKSNKLGYAANLLVLTCIFHYMGSCMLGSIVALTSLTGNSIPFVAGLAIGGTVGVFYTTIGGLKAVVWTDVMQSGVMLVGMVVIIAKSIADTPGGQGRIWRECVTHGRLHAPSLSIDPTVRLTLWNLLLGPFVDWGSLAGQPPNVQRLCSLEKKRDAYIASAVASLLFLLFTLLPAWAGLNIFGFYASRGCDIHAAGWVPPNEIITYFVRERLPVPGFQGLFVAALFAAALSSLSSGLNSASAIIWKDTLQPLLAPRISERTATLASKAGVVLFGALAMGWCFILNLFGGVIIQVSSSTSAAMYVAYVGMFVNAVLVRFTSVRGAICALLLSCGVTLWLGVGSLLHGAATAAFLPSTTERCDANVTAERPVLSEPPQGGRSVYSLSYLWLCVICLCLSLLTNLVVSGAGQLWKGRSGGQRTADSRGKGEEMQMASAS